MNIEISQEKLTATIELLAALQSRLEAEAASYALLAQDSLTARRMAAERLEMAELAGNLFDFFTHV